MGNGDSKAASAAVQHDSDFSASLAEAQRRDDLGYEEIVASPKKKLPDATWVHHDHSDGPPRRLNFDAISEAGLGYDNVGSPLRVQSQHAGDEGTDDAATNPERLALAVRTHARRIPDDVFLELHDVQGDVGALAAWIARHGLRVCDSRGITLLHLVNSVKFYEFLLSRAGLADMINVRDFKNRTALHYRCERGAKLEVISYLIEHGAFPIARDQDMVTPIALAAARNQAHVVRLLLEKYDVPVESITDRRGQNCFHEAAWNGALEALDVLIDHAARRGVLAQVVDAVDDRGVSPFLAACTDGHVDIVAKLLSDPRTRPLIDVDRVDAEGDGALNRCTWDGHLPVARLLLGLPANAAADVDEHAPEDDPYSTPVKQTRGKQARKAVVADINIRDKAGLTPLHSAVYNRQARMVALLLGQGAAVDAQDDIGDTPLHVLVEGATADAHVESVLAIARLLTRAGSNIYIKNAQNVTAPQLAVQQARAQSGDEEGSRAVFCVAEFLVKFIKGLAATRRQRLAEISLQLQRKQQEAREQKQQQLEETETAAAGAATTTAAQEEVEAGAEADEEEEQTANEAADPAAATFDEDALDRAFAEEALKAQQQDASDDNDRSGYVDEDALHAAFEAAAEPGSPAFGSATALAGSISQRNPELAAAVADAVHAEVSRAEWPAAASPLTASLAASAAASSPFDADGNAAPSSPTTSRKAALRQAQRDIAAAIDGGSLDAVKQLVHDSSAALLSAKDAQGRTPLHLAAAAAASSGGNGAKILSFLLHSDTSGGDVVKARDAERGRTCLFYAIDAGVESVKLLLALHPDLVHMADNAGDTPLHAAAVSGTKMMLRILSLHGANPTALNKAGKTALQLAEAAGKAENAAYLRVVSAFSHSA